MTGVDDDVFADDQGVIIRNIGLDGQTGFISSIVQIPHRLGFGNGWVASNSHVYGGEDGVLVQGSRVCNTEIIQGEAGKHGVSLPSRARTRRGAASVS